MPKVRIVHKGLTLICVPLVFGITFLLLLTYGLSESNRRLQHELLLKDAMITVDIISRRIFCGRICSLSYYASKEDFFQKSYARNMHEAAVSFKYLQKLLKNESSLKMHLAMLKENIVLGTLEYRIYMVAPIGSLSLQDLFGLAGDYGVKRFFINPAVFLMMETLREQSSYEAEAALSSMNWFQTTLIAGAPAIILISVGLVVFFSRSITNRLLIIVENTRRLSKGLPLKPPLEGDDEIAELDQFLFKSATEIRELESFKQEMIGVVSHELKSPLTSVECFLALLAEGVFGELSPKAQIKVEQAHKSVLRLMSLVRELLDLDRLEAGKFEMTPELISDDELVTASVDTVGELSERSGIVIDIKSSGEKVLADRNRLIQVIVNLLSNALKFSPKGGRVTLETRIVEGCLECRVIDQGRGIPESLRKEIFEPFKQVDAKDETNKKGTGLGLAISRSIVEQHGGIIGVDSVEGKGSTFWFKIPVSGTDSASAISAKPQANAVESQILRREIYSKGGFTVLQKGLVLISVPLIFQLVFASIIGALFFQFREQVHREEHSKEIVATLNNMEEKLALASNDGVLYAASQKPAYLQSWRNGRKEVYAMLDHVKALASKDKTQTENIRQAADWLDKTSTLLDVVFNSKETNLGKLLVDTGFVELSKPLAETQEAQEALLLVEKKHGEALAAQRKKMIKNMQAALWTGILINILLSICLSVYLLRGITNRLRHVMKNTAHLVKRENLEAPLKGSDEIAYLDRVFFETANHLVELETFKRQLISIVSHELRTPLLAVSASLELVASGALGDLSDKARARVNFAEEETCRLIRLINNLLDIEKMEAGKFVLDVVGLQVKDLIEASTATVAQLADLKSIVLETPSSELRLKADRDRIIQVIINLLSNAIKFSPEGGTIKIQVEEKQAQLEFRVIDQGKGVPEELKDKIFNRFVQVEKKDATERGGSGLGLAIARAIVEQHGGTIGVESTPGVGSNFWFRLPLEKI